MIKKYIIFFFLSIIYSTILQASLKNEKKKFVIFAFSTNEYVQIRFKLSFSSRFCCCFYCFLNIFMRVSMCVCVFQIFHATRDFLLSFYKNKIKKRSKRDPTHRYINIYTLSLKNKKNMIFCINIFIYVATYIELKLLA